MKHQETNNSFRPTSECLLQVARFVEFTPAIEIDGIAHGYEADRANIFHRERGKRINGNFFEWYSQLDSDKQNRIVQRIVEPIA